MTMARKGGGGVGWSEWGGGGGVEGVCRIRVAAQAPGTSLQSLWPWGPYRRWLAGVSGLLVAVWRAPL